VTNRPCGQNNRSGKCIFCGGGNLSKEHFWPDWASALLPRYDNNRQIEQRFTFTEKTKLEAPPETRSRPGHTWTKKIRVVCRSCNNGWMSVLETAAKPVLIPLIVTRHHTLTADAKRVLSQWIALKIMVGERNHPEDAVTPREDRAKFRVTLEVPSGFQMWVARCGAGGWKSAYLRHAATIGASPVIMPHHRFKNIHSVAFGIGDLFVFVVQTTVEGLIKFNTPPSGAVIPLFPVAGSCNWPPTRSLSEGEASAVAGTLDRLFTSPAVRWMPGFPP
jgi:hypothetical protein